MPRNNLVSRQRPMFIDKVAGILVPMCLFVEPGNFFFLTNASLYEVERFAVPLSLVASPIFMIFIFHHGFQKYLRVVPLIILVVLFIVYCLVMGAFNSITRESEAILYAYQWVLPYLWLPYFLTIMGTPRFGVFCQWLFLGVAFTVSWYAFSALLEIALDGGLGDAGRMTQNRIFPGQYQIAVYVPTVISLSVLLVNGLFFAEQLKVSRKWLLGLNALTLFALLTLAAREGLLVYLLANALMLAVRNSHFKVALLFGGFVIGAMLIINLNAIFEAFAASDFRMLNKIAALQDEGAGFGGRDVMIRDALRVFFWDPVFGSRFLPPNVSDFGRGVVAPSAHNMYVDAFVWSGLAGGFLFLLICIRLLIVSVSMIIDRSPHVPKYTNFLGVLLMVFLIVSNNTNVPMRQPVVGPLVALMVAMAIHYLAVKHRNKV